MKNVWFTLATLKFVLQSTHVNYWKQYCIISMHQGKYWPPFVRKNPEKAATGLRSGRHAGSRQVSWSICMWWAHLYLIYTKLHKLCLRSGSLLLCLMYMLNLQRVAENVPEVSANNHGCNYGPWDCIARVALNERRSDAGGMEEKHMIKWRWYLMTFKKSLSCKIWDFTFSNQVFRSKTWNGDWWNSCYSYKDSESLFIQINHWCYQAICLWHLWWFKVTRIYLRRL
jgi:hypothetical protein